QRFDEHADEEQQDVDQQQEDQRIVGDLAEQDRHLLGHLVDGEQIGEHGREGDDQHDDRRHDRRTAENGQQVLEGHFLVDEHADDQPVDHGHAGRLGGGEKAPIDAAENDDGHEQGQDRFAEGAPDAREPV